MYNNFKYGYHDKLFGHNHFLKNKQIKKMGRPHYVWNEYLYSVLEKVEVRVTVSVTVCVVLLCCVG